MILAATGHRPNKLGGHNSHTFDRLFDLARAALTKQKPTHVVSGMAVGWDQAVANAATDLGIPWTAAIPFRGQESQWPEETQQRYTSLLSDARRIEYVCEPGYAAWKMQVRNEYMVNNADKMLALWDGSPGGTGNCLKCAYAKGKPVINLWSSWVKFKDRPAILPR